MDTLDFQQFVGAMNVQQRRGAHGERRGAFNGVLRQCGNNGAAVVVWRGGSVGNLASSLPVFIQYLIAGSNISGNMRDKGAAFDGAAILAAGDDFLSRIAAFLKVHGAQAFVTQHLWHKGARYCRAYASGAAAHFGKEPLGSAKRLTLRRGGICSIQPQDARGAISGRQGDEVCIRRCFRCFAHQPDKLPRAAGVGKLHFGAQHVAAQPREGGFQHVGADDEQHFISVEVQGVHAGEHAPLGVAERGEGTGAGGKVRDVLRQLPVQESDGVGAADADDAQVGQGDAAAQGGSGWDGGGGIVHVHSIIMRCFSGAFYGAFYKSFLREKTPVRILWKFLVFLLATLSAALLALGGAMWWGQQPLALAADEVEVSVPTGASLRMAAQRLHAAGVQVPPRVLALYFRWAVRGRSIQPGEYAVTRGMSAEDVLERMARGERTVLAVTLVEGWTFAQALQALARAPHLRHDASTLSPAAVMSTLGRPGVAAEGRFFPDTFHYTKESSELDILRQSMQLMDKRLASAWQARAPDVPLKSAEEALILASIIEKETGRAADRAEIAGVFANRLRQGMKLQTDPSVIYGLGAAYDGTLRRSQLQEDTPYNTYTRVGLPPTPIALPGKAALLAAVRPAATRSLYFVARGDGSSQFSETLEEHNRAVQHYQRGGGRR